MSKKKGKKENKKKGKKSGKTNSKSKIKIKKRDYFIYGGLILAILIALFVSSSDLGIMNDNNNQSSDQEEVVATVNQEKITREDLDLHKTVLQQQGQNVGDERALQDLINQKLLYQEAKKEVNLSDKQVEANLEQRLASQGMSLDDFKQQISKQGEDYGEIKNRLRKQIILSQYYQVVRQESDINVSDDEAKTFYEQNEQMISQQAPNSSFEDLKPVIKQQLKQQKMQQVVQNLLNNLRSNASIQINEEKLNKNTQPTKVELPSGMAQ